MSARYVGNPTVSTRYPELEAAWAELNRAKTKVTAVHWTSDHDVLVALLAEVRKFDAVVHEEWARAYAERPIEPADYPVHASHCCKEHGCKYGYDKTCPVITGQTTQEYPCEFCEEDTP